MRIVRWWQSAIIVGSAALSVHIAYYVFQCLGYMLGTRSPCLFADLCIGVTAALSYHGGLAAAKVFGGLERATVHIGAR